MNDNYFNNIFSINNSTEFERLALQAYNFQINNNIIYRKYASIILQDKKPEKIEEIPFLPISFFKSKQVICEKQKVEKIFYSSGTQGVRSKHYISDITIYERSFRTAFNKFYNNVSDYCILSLLPNYRKNPNSSLIYMVDDLIKKSKHIDSNYYFDKYKSLAEKIQALEKKKEKTLLIGTSETLLHLADKYPMKLENTIVIETGGTKGGSNKRLLKEELHKILKEHFKLKNIHSEYGMTELLSQSYSKGDGVFISPLWKKVLIRDITDPLSIIGNNKTGGVNIIDLANIYSCPFIATQDLGRTNEDSSFSILGRFDNSDIRGCNLLTV